MLPVKSYNIFMSPWDLLIRLEYRPSLLNQRVAQLSENQSDEPSLKYSQIGIYWKNLLEEPFDKLIKYLPDTVGKESDTHKDSE